MSVKEIIVSCSGGKPWIITHAGVFILLGDDNKVHIVSADNVKFSKEGGISIEGTGVSLTPEKLDSEKVREYEKEVEQHCKEIKCYRYLAQGKSCYTLIFDLARKGE